MTDEPLRADSIVFNDPHWPDVPTKVCSVCTYEFLSRDYIIERVVWNEGGQLDMWETEYVHLHCAKVRIISDE